MVNISYRIVLCIVFCIVFSSSSLAQVSTPRGHTFNLESVPVREFVLTYTDMTGRSVIVKPDVYGFISVYNAQIRSTAIHDFFEKVMNAHGFSVTNSNPAVIDYLPDNELSTSYDVSEDERSPLDLSSLGFTNEVAVPDVDLVDKVYSFDEVRAVDVVAVINSALGSGDRASFNASSALVMAGSNAVAVSAPADIIEFLDTIYPDLDSRHPQVFIRAIFFETSENSAFDLGLGFGTTDGNTVVGGSNTNALGDTLRSVGGTFGIFDGDMLSLAMRAVQRDGSARLLSTPHVLTQSGSSGRINVGQVVPVVTGRVTGEAASVDSPFQTIERISVGLGLSVRPSVLAGGRIVMDVTASADTVSEASFAADIVTNERNITTTVSLMPGQTLALGGLISDDETESVSGVPLLSDLPLVGGIFRSTSTTSERRVLHVLLTAEIID